jgi:beta-lactamase superfamily II metal-dependent hydrolase
MKPLRYLASISTILLLATLVPASQAASKPLQVYFVDVDGGQATLFVTPNGKSLLIDTGWAGNNGLYANRIVAAAKAAGITKIDDLLITHYHADHVGGIPELVERIPVDTFVDHGPDRDPGDADTTRGFEAYQKVLAAGHYHHISPKPGEELAIKGMKVQVITSDGQAIDKPLPGAGEPNTFCEVSETKPADHTENAYSLGVLITFGKTKILDLGDLTWEKEKELMCPNNKIGKVDILVVAHHGLFQSSSPAMVEAVQPRIAIMDNGAKKGGSIPVFETLAKTAGLETLWQLHFSDEAGVEHNTAPEYIANPVGKDDANYLKLTVDKKGSFSVLNSRTGVSKDYPAR